MNLYEHALKYPEQYITQEEYKRYFKEPRTMFTKEIEEKIKIANA